MIAVIKGDIVSSRKMENSEKWLLPLKDLLNEWGKSPGQWEVVWGDSFQLEADRPDAENPEKFNGIDNKLLPLLKN